MKKIIYLIYLLPIIVLSYLFWQNTKPVLEVRCDVLGKTRLCGELVPTARVNKTKDGVLILEEPVYFDVKLPRKYDRVEAVIEYADLKTDILELGVAQDAAKKSFDFFAMENKILDNLGWKKIEQDGLVLYQKNPVYKNITDFRVNPPKFFETLVYRAELAPKFGIMSAKGSTVIDFPVRENIKLLVYKASAAPQVMVDYSVIPARPQTPERSDGGQAKAGIQSNNDEIPYQVRNEQIGQNLYAINLVGSEETVFKKISIDSPYAAIANKIKIGQLYKPLTIYSAGSRLLANAYAAGGAQVIDANGQIINIKKIKEQYTSIFKNIKLRPVEIPKGEVELSASLFFISDKNIFYPRYEAFYSGADLSKVNFILAKYQSPITVIASPEQSGWRGNLVNGEIAASPTPRNDRLAKAIFNIADTPTPDRKMRFLFSLPNAAKGDLVKIKSIKLKFTGENFSILGIWNKILNIFSLF